MIGFSVQGNSDADVECNLESTGAILLDKKSLSFNATTNRTQLVGLLVLVSFSFLFLVGGWVGRRMGVWVGRWVSA